MINSDWSLCVAIEDVSPHYAKTQAWATWSFSWFTMDAVCKRNARVPTKKPLEELFSRSGPDP